MFKIINGEYTISIYHILGINIAIIIFLSVFGVIYIKNEIKNKKNEN